MNEEEVECGVDCASRLRYGCGKNEKAHEEEEI
jgi:hypothetical protein